MSIVPRSLMYKSGGMPIAIAASRRTVKVIPEAGSSKYNPNTNNTIRIDLSPSLGFLDCHNSYLSFRVKTMEGTVDHTKECRMDKNSMSWVRRFTIHSSTGSILEDIDHYNLCVNLLHTTTGGTQYSKTIGQMVDNTGNRACRNAAMANKSGAQFNSGFDASGILSGEHMLPLAFMQGPMTIELVLADFKDCFVGTSASGKQASYEIDNVELHASVLSMSEEYNAKFSEQLRTRGIDLSFNTYKTHVTTLISANMDLPISQNSASVRGSYHVLRSKDKYNSPLYDSLSTYKSGNLEEVMWDLGGQLYPTQPLKLKDDGVTSLYSHNLQSWNMFRNHALGCQVDDTNFWSSEATQQSHGVTKFKALPVRRVYGTWVANGSKAYAQYGKTTSAIPDAGAVAGTFIADADLVGAAAGTVLLSQAQMALLRAARTIAQPTMLFPNHEVYQGVTMTADRTVELTHMVQTLHFVPDNPQDIPLVDQGMRCKIGYRTEPPGEASDDGDVDLVSTLNDYVGLTNLAEGASKLGLDRFYSAKPAETNIAGYSENNYDDKSGVVMYAGAPCQVAWGHTNTTDVAARHIAGIGIPFVDGKNRPILSKRAAVAFEGWVDCIPSDEQFYIGNSFETFNAENSLISGSDLTNATPLHVRLTYKDQTEKTEAEQFFENMHTQDVFTTFINQDAVLRMQPDGTVISSV